MHASFKASVIACPNISKFCHFCYQYFRKMLFSPPYLQVVVDSRPLLHPNPKPSTLTLNLTLTRHGVGRCAGDCGTSADSSQACPSLALLAGHAHPPTCHCLKHIHNFTLPNSEFNQSRDSRASTTHPSTSHPLPICGPR